LGIGSVVHTYLFVPKKKILFNCLLIFDEIRVGGPFGGQTPGSTPPPLLKFLAIVKIIFLMWLCHGLLPMNHNNCASDDFGR
jgi:hypothetical protein